MNWTIFVCAKCELQGSIKTLIMKAHLSCCYIRRYNSAHVHISVSNILNYNLCTIHIFSFICILTGDVTYIKKRSRWQSNLAIKSPLIIGSVDGYVEKGAQNDLVSSRLELEYTLDPQQRRSKQERFTVSNKWRYSNRANNRQYSLDT